MFFFGKVKNTENDWGFDVFSDTFEQYIEITDEEHDTLVEEANKNNKWITGDRTGNPILINPPEPTEHETIERHIEELQGFLATTDWYAIRFADTGTLIPAEIKKQRQSARDSISELRDQLKNIDD